MIFAVSILTCYIRMSVQLDPDGNQSSQPRLGEQDHRPQPTNHLGQRIMWPTVSRYRGQGERITLSLLDQVVSAKEAALLLETFDNNCQTILAILQLLEYDLAMFQNAN